MDSEHACQVSDFDLASAPSLALVNHIIALSEEYECESDFSVDKILEYASGSNKALCLDAVQQGIEFDKPKAPSSIKMVKFFRKLGFDIPCGEGILREAILKHEVDLVISYFQCTADRDLKYYYAILESGNFELIEWAESQHFPPLDPQMAYRSSILGFSPAVAQYIYDKGLRWKSGKDYFEVSCMFYRFEMIRWLFEHGWEVNPTRLLRKIITKSATLDLPLVRYFHESLKVDLEDIVPLALEELSLIVAKYCFEKGVRLAAAEIVSLLHSQICKKSCRNFDKITDLIRLFGLTFDTSHLSDIFHRLATTYSECDLGFYEPLVSQLLNLMASFTLSKTSIRFSQLSQLTYHFAPPRAQSNASFPKFVAFARSWAREKYQATGQCDRD